MCGGARLTYSPPMRFPMTVALVAGAALALGACGDDEDTTGSASGAAKAPAAADAVRFVSIVDNGASGDFRPQVRLGLDAALKEINDAGGVHGKPLRIDICETDAGPDAYASCVRKGVADKGVLASVGGFSFSPKTGVPLMEQAGMPDIGSYVLDAIMLDSEASFPLASVQNGFLNAAVLPAAVLKAKRLAAAVLDVPVGRGAAQQIQGIASATGAKVTKTVFIDAKAADLSAQVQALKSAGTDAIITILPDQLTARFIQGYRQVDPDTPIVTTAAAFSPKFVGQLGAAAKELYVGAQFARDSAGEKAFQDSAKAVGDPSIATDLSRNSYVAAKLAAAGLEAAGAEPTRAKLHAAMQKLDAFDTQGMTPPLDFTKSHPLFPRAALRTGVFGKVEGGDVVQVAKDFVPSMPDKAPGQ